MADAKIADWLRHLDLDRPVAYALATRCWQFPAGLVTTILIALCFTPELQGYYYTISTLLALQTLVDLGLPLVILHFASHEWSLLQLGDQGQVTGDEVAGQRLAGLVVFSTRWFCWAALIFACAAGLSGGWLFGRAAHDLSWLLPGCGVILLAANSLALSPRIATLEGCQQVLAVNRTRLWQAVTGSLAVWGAMLAGAGLWAVVVAAGIQLAWEIQLLWGSYRSFFRSLLRRAQTRLANRGVAATVADGCSVRRAVFRLLLIHAGHVRISRCGCGRSHGDDVEYHDEHSARRLCLDPYPRSSLR